MAENIKQTAITSITKFANSDHYQTLFKNALGKKAGQFTTSIIELTTNDAQLQKCDQRLVLAEAAKAATLDLPLNKQIGFAYVITFNNEKPNGEKVPVPTLVISSRGFIQLALRTGQYKYLNADVVYEGELQSKDKLTGALDINGERKSDKVVGFFAHFTTINGFSKTLYMTVDEMCHYAKTYSPSIKRSKDITEKVLAQLMQKVATEGPIAGTVGWKGDPISMAIKTVLKRLLYKYGYLSVELAQAYNADESVSEETHEASAPTEVIDITATATEIVDHETGEITPATVPAAPVPSDSSLGSPTPTEDEPPV